MNEILYNLDDKISLVKNENEKYFVVNKENDNVSFNDLLNLENKLEEVSKKYILAVNKYNVVQDKIKLRSMFNAIIYSSSALLCLCSTFIDIDMFLYILCIQFLVLKSILLFYYGTKNYLEDELKRIKFDIDNYKNIYDVYINIDKYNKEKVNYSMYPASVSEIESMKSKCNKVYKLEK